MTNEYLLDRDDKQYIEVEEFEKYELINCVTYEMAVRNSDILTLTLIWNVISEHIPLSQKLTKFIEKKIDNFDFLNNSDNIFKDTNLKNTIQDKLEHTYFFNVQLDNNWIYRYNFSPVFDSEYKCSLQVNTTTHSKSYSLSKCHSNIKTHDGFSIEVKFINIDYVKLNEGEDINYETYNLDRDRFKELNDVIESVKNERIINPSFSRPIIKGALNSSKLTRLENINLALPAEELTSYILHIKKKFDFDNSIVPSLKEIMKDKHYELEDINNFSQRDWADCFFIYDYYQKSTFSINETARYIEEIFNKYHGIKIPKTIDELKKGESTTKIIPYYFYIQNKDKYDKRNITISSYYSISTIKSRNKLMKKFIDDLKYKNLIGG